MPEVTIDGKELGSVLERAGKFVHRSIQAAALEAAHRGRTLIIKTIIPSIQPIPFNTGAFSRSWKVELVQSESGNYVVLYSDSPYAAIIELGRRPGARRPPVEPIMEWVRRKMRRELRRQFRMPRRGVTPGARVNLGSAIVAAAAEREIRSRAFAIARAIGERGLTPKHVLAQARPQIMAFFKEALSKRLQGGQG